MKLSFVIENDLFKKITDFAKLIMKNNVMYKYFKIVFKQIQRHHRVKKYIVYIADASQRRRLVTDFYDNEHGVFVRNKIVSFATLNSYAINCIDLFTKNNDYTYNDSMLDVFTVKYLNKKLRRKFIIVKDNTYTTKKDNYYSASQKEFDDDYYL